MKISVITLHTVNNYGSVLQTYATQSILEKMGHTVEFVDYWRKNTTIESKVDSLLQTSALQRLKPVWNLNSVTRKMVRVPLRFIVRQNSSATRQFLHQYIHTTHPYYSNEELLADPPIADIYMTGSDQVWNSVWNEGIDKPFFLSFAPDHKRKVAFAASIGRTELNPEEIPETKAALERYDAISMRESSGVALLSQLGIKSVPILDPTLMLEGNEWRKIAIQPRVAKPFMVVYQLNANPDMDIYAEKLSKKKGWEIIRLSYGRSDAKKAGKSILRPKVEELLGYIDTSSCVLTDSFHITSFALNLGKQFVTVPPPRFGTRIENILKVTDTRSQLLTDYNDFDVCDHMINFAAVNEKLNAERKKGYQWLNEVLSDKWGKGAK